MGEVDALEWACVLCGHCIQNYWVSRATNLPQNFALSLNIALQKLFRWFRDDAAMGNWWLTASSWQWTCSCTTSCAEFFGETSNYPGESVPVQHRFGALWLLAFPETKITFEKEETSDHQWDSGKYDVTTDGDWENCVRSQDAYFGGIIVLCTVFLVSCIFLNNCLHFSYYMAGYLLDRLLMVSWDYQFSFKLKTSLYI